MEGGNKIIQRPGWVRVFYNILFDVFFFLTAPYYFLRMRRRGGWKQGFGERLGRYSTKFKQSITNRDLVVVRDVVTLLAAMVVFVNFIVDVLYALIDPRLEAADV